MENDPYSNYWVILFDIDCRVWKMDGRKSVAFVKSMVIIYLFCYDWRHPGPFNSAPTRLVNKKIFDGNKKCICRLKIKFLKIKKRLTPKKS